MCVPSVMMFFKIEGYGTHVKYCSGHRKPKPTSRAAPVVCQSLVTTPRKIFMNAFVSMQSTGNMLSAQWDMVRSRGPFAFVIAPPMHACPIALCSIRLSCLTSIGAPYGQRLFNIFVHTGPRRNSPPSRG